MPNLSGFLTALNTLKLALNNCYCYDVVTAVLKKRLFMHFYKINNRLFQSTLSVRRATISCELAPPIAKFQSTLSVRRATELHSDQSNPYHISIHALREESDSFLLDNMAT